MQEGVIMATVTILVYIITFLVMNLTIKREKVRFNINWHAERAGWYPLDTYKYQLITYFNLGLVKETAFSLFQLKIACRF